MKFQTHNDKQINADGSLMDCITANYSDLKKIFGKPTEGDGYKVDAEWEIEFEDGTVATIYNWKDGKNYCGKSGLAKTKITDWHVGGRTMKSVERVKEVLLSRLKVN
jgi:hypothetical protein